jgi:hypothetical protein
MEFILLLLLLLLINNIKVALDTFQFLNLIHGRTPWTGNQPVARPVPTHRTTQTE